VSPSAVNSYSKYSKCRKRFFNITKALTFFCFFFWWQLERRKHVCDSVCDSVCDCAHEDQSDNQGTRQLPQVMRACGSVTSVRSTTKHTHARAVHGPREASASHDCMCSQRTHSRASHDCKDSKDDACELAGMLQDCMQALIDITERERAPEQSSSLSLPPPPPLSPPSGINTTRAHYTKSTRRAGSKRRRQKASARTARPDRDSTTDDAEAPRNQPPRTGKR